MDVDHKSVSTKVRVLNAACFAPTVQVMVGSRSIAAGLGYGEVSEYQTVTEGFRQVSVMDSKQDAAPSANEEAILSETLPFYGGRQVTLVFCNTMNSISLIPMEESSCYAGKNRGCVRFANFSFGDGPFDVLDVQGNVAYSDIMPREITQFLPAVAGDYEFSLVRTGSEYIPDTELVPGQDARHEMKVRLQVMPEVNYTVCILGACAGEMPLKTKVLEF